MYPMSDLIANLNVDQNVTTPTVNSSYASPLLINTHSFFIEQPVLATIGLFAVAFIGYKLIKGKR